MSFELPKDWSEVTVDKFIQLKGIEEKDFATLLSFKLEQIFILTGTDSEDEIWEETPAEKLSELVKQLDFLTGSPSHNFKREINGLHYKESITLGEFIDLEYLCGINYFEKLPDICAILYRKNILNEWGHPVIEPRGYNESERGETFLELPIENIYGVLQSYLSLKKKILDAYGEMLNEYEKEEPAEQVDGPLDPEEEKAKKDEQLAKKWAWERVIHHYTQKSNLTFREVTNLPLIFFMNQIAMFHDLKI